ERERAAGKRQTVTVGACAPGYVEESLQAELAPGGTQLVNIPLRALRSGLIGKLVDAETGKPISQVEGLLSQDGGQPNVVLTGDDGEFRSASVTPGKYVFATHAPRYYDEQVEVAVEPG